MALSRTELRQKISEKLVELGCLLDDELPDYVAAMVANGKTREHMSEDLSVFIGVQSEPFLNWLMDIAKEKKATKAESTSVKSVARLVSRDEPERRGTSQPSHKGSNSSGRLLSIAVAKATADTASSKSQSVSDDTSSRRHPQPVAEGSVTHSSSSRKRTRHASPENHKDSRSSKSRGTTESRSNGEKATSSVKTKFIVTLDGADAMKDAIDKRREVQPADTMQFTVSTQSGDLKRRHIEVENEPEPESEVVAEEPTTEGDVALGNGNSNDQAATEVVEPAAKRSLERCRFWPQCTAGDSCQYHHPSAPCRHMPNCRYGAQCLFVHSDCKFDGHCSRADCPFVHRVQTKAGQFSPTISPAGSALTTPAAKAAPSATICKFLPNCMRPHCPFLHPTACRFGSSCKRQGCSFYHAPAAAEPSAVPDRSSLRWSAKKPHLSERRFAAPEATEAVAVGCSGSGPSVPVASDS